jgi:hypothetical protein
VREALERFLAAHEPYPALVVDRHGNLVLANAAVTLLSEGVAAELLEPPANALRATLHPEGMASRIVNLGEWSAHLLHRLEREIVATGDPELEVLRDELLTYPGVRTAPQVPESAVAAEIVLPLQLRDGDDRLSFLGTVTTFGTPADVTLAELSLEAFYPADSATAARLATLRA